MKLYDICKTIFLRDGNVEVELKITSPELRHFFWMDGVSGRVSDIPAYLGGEECRCMPDLKSDEPRYIITL